MNVSIKNIFKKITDRVKRQKAIRGKYADSLFEKCVICGKTTTVRKDAHIDFRANYEIGVGQFCNECHKTLTEESLIGRYEK